MKNKLRVSILLALFAISLNLKAQHYDLSLIRGAINGWKSLQGCAFGESNGTIAWYDSYGYQYVHLNNQIGNIIQEINRNKQSIDYISLADNGNYAIISNNGLSWHALGPQSFYEALNAVVNNGGIKSATIDINNNYFILGKNGTVKTNMGSWLSFYNSQKSRMGEGRSAWSNGNAFVVCFDKGVVYSGTAPTDFYNKIKELDFIPDVAQFGKCGNYVFSTRNGKAWYRVNDYSRYETTNNISWHPTTNNSNSSSPGYYVPLPTVPTTYPCGVCSSTGRCLQCGGTGISPNHASGIKANCGYCGGTGKCGTCKGKGYN